jgi:hypothetical protein
MNTNSQDPEIEPDEPDLDEVETAWTAERRKYLRTLLSRAAGAYLVLFLGLGLLMSALGVNPLTNDGLMPKLLLVFVGLALAAALAGSLSDLVRQQGRGWLKVAHRLKDTPTHEKSGD